MKKQVTPIENMFLNEHRLPYFQRTMTMFLNNMASFGVWANPNSSALTTSLPVFDC
jgi:hypothetical protein